MICPGCGGANPDGMRFCGHCGSALTGAHSGDSALRKLVSKQVADRLTEGGAITDDWRLVTTLFADISGYVALSERLDPEALLDATAPIVAMMTGVAERYEAHVAKFAGDALLCMFGAPVVHEDDADRALLAALAMIDELDALRPSLPEAARNLELHIGINTGRVVAAVFGAGNRIDYNVAGEAVNIAQRLESVAPGGQIYVGDATVKLTEGRFDFQHVGALTVKGLSTPVIAWRLAGRKDVAEPQAGAPLIGRDDELRLIHRALESLQQGSGSLVTIEGDPGEGKSRLVRDSIAHHQGRRVWCGFTALPSAPYQAVADVLRGALALESDERLAPALFALGCADAEPYLAGLLGTVAHPPGLDPESFASRASVALRDAIAAAAREMPLLIVVEDLHWADRASLSMLEGLAGLVDSHPILMMTTSRPVGDGLGRIAAAASRPVRVSLKPLDGRALDEMVSCLLGTDDVSPVIHDAVAERSGGNPYFVEEMLRYAVDRGTIRRGLQGWELAPDFDTHGVPPTIEGIIAARIDRLPPSAAQTLQVAAVAGEEATGALLRTVLRSAADVDAALAVLKGAGLLHLDGDAVAFHHVLVAHVVYERLLRRRRAELHGAVADAIEQEFGAGDDVVDVLARHRYRSGDAEAAFPVLVRAGERARRLFANDIAAAHYEHAADVAPPDRMHEMMLIAGDLADVRGDYSRAAGLYSRVRRETGDHRATRGLASALRKRGEYAEALQVLAESLETQDHPGLRLEQGWTLSVEGRYPEAIAALKAGLETAGRDAIAAPLLLELARAETVERDLEQALGHAHQARIIFEGADDVRGVAMSIRVAGAALHRLGRLDEAVATLTDGLALARRTGSIEEEGACLINLGMVELERGSIDEAIAHDREAIGRFERIGHGSGRAIGYGNLAEKLLRRGDLDEAQAWCDRALAHARAIGHTPTIADASMTSALIAKERGDIDASQMLAGAAAATYEQMGLENEAARARAL